MEKQLVFWNPWWEPGFKGFDLFERASFVHLLKITSRKEALFLSGVRRSGKTSAMYYIISKLLQTGVDKRDILYINLDDEALRHESLENIYTTYKTLFTHKSEKLYIFLDEVQNVEGWQRWVKNHYDALHNIKFIISGSQSHALKTNASLLTGRILEMIFFPLSFEEFVGLKKLPTTKTGMIAHAPELLAAFKEYMQYGGFPEAVLEDDPRLKTLLLKEYYENIKNKDIIAYFSIKDAKKFNDLSYFVASNIARPYSANKIGSTLGLSPSVVDQYVHYATLMYLFLPLHHFNYSVKSQVTMPRKMYLIDQGLVNAVAFNFSEDAGRLLENVVYIELMRRHSDIYYHKQQYECDFLIRQGTKVKTAIQVCHKLSSENRERELRGLLEAMHAHNVDSGLLLTYDQEETIQDENKMITVLPVWQWLLANPEQDKMFENL